MGASRTLILAILCLLVLPDASNAFRNRVTAGLRIGDSEFFCNYDRLTYVDATNRCRGRGMVLAAPKGDRNMIARIRDHCTYQRANENFKQWWLTSNDMFRLGGRKERNANYHVWNDDEIVRKEAWIPNEPDNYGGTQHCITGLHGLDDDHCHVKRFYVCERRN